MTVETHLAALQQKRATLKQEILEEETRPKPDTLRLSSLKRQNLRLKDEITRLQTMASARAGVG